MLRTRARIIVWVGFLPACGSTEHGGDFSGSGGTGGAQATTGGASAAGASGAAGASSVGGAGPAGAGGVGGTTAIACNDPGVKLASGPCYVPCVYAPGSPPRYEDPAGACSNIGWKCTVFQYCNPNIHCKVDASCQQFGGPGWICVPTPDGPLVGQCALKCETDADCPDSKGATPSPYACKAVDNGTTVVKICRF